MGPGGWIDSAWSCGLDDSSVGECEYSVAVKKARDRGVVTCGRQWGRGEVPVAGVDTVGMEAWASPTLRATVTRFRSEWRNGRADTGQGHKTKKKTERDRWKDKKKSS